MNPQLHVDDTDVICPVTKAPTPWELGHLDGLNARETSPESHYTRQQRAEYFRGYVEGAITSSHNDKEHRRAS